MGHSVDVQDRWTDGADTVQSVMKLPRRRTRIIIAPVQYTMSIYNAKKHERLLSD